MSGTVVFVDLTSKERLGSMGVVEGKSVILDGWVPSDALDYRVRIGADLLTSADGEKWLYALALRWSGDPVGIYVPPAGEPMVEDARHYPGGHGHDQTKHGKKKDETSDYEDPWGVLTDEAQRVEQALLHGAVSDVKSLGEANIQGGIRTWECGVADVGGVKTFIKAADVDGEQAGYLVNQMMNDLVEIPVLVRRKIPQTVEGHMAGVAGYEAVFMRFVDDARPNADYNLMKPYALYDLAVFDAVTSNSDRHPGNILTRGDGSIVAVDQGFCLAFEGASNRTAGVAIRRMRREGLMPSYGTDVLPLQPEHRQRLERLKMRLRSGGRKKLRPLVGAAAIDMMVKRINWMLRTGTVLFTWQDAEAAMEESVDA